VDHFELAVMWVINYTAEYACMLSADMQRVVMLYIYTEQNYTKTEACSWHQYKTLSCETDEWERRKPNIHKDALYGSYLQERAWIYA